MNTVTRFKNFTEIQDEFNSDTFILAFDEFKHEVQGQIVRKSDDCEINAVMFKDGSGIVLNTYKGRMQPYECENEEKLSKIYLSCLADSDFEFEERDKAMLLVVLS